MAAEAKPVLREFQPLINILQTVPHRLQKGLFSQDIEWTCLDVTKEFVAVGTNVGIAFLYDRYKCAVKRLQCPGDDTVVTCVSLQSSVDYVVAVGTESAHVYIFQLPSLRFDRLTQLKVFKVENVHQVAVQCLAWSMNTMKLFSGDVGGSVICTEIYYFEETCRSYEVCRESHAIIQLCYAYKTLLVSTLSRTVICFVNEGDARIVQVGQKPRKGLDAFGSVFLRGSYQAKDAVLFVVRPGLRIWKACGVTGVVQATYMYRDLMTEPSHAIELLPDASCDFSLTSASDRQFGRLLLFNDTQLVTYRGTRLCVIDPGLGQFVGYHANLGYILGVAVCGSEIFVLRKVDSGRRLIRLGFAAELPNEIPRPLAADKDGMQATPSPVHAIVHSASVMSRGIVGALKGVGSLLHSSVQEGQTTSRDDDANKLPHSDSIDSSKEASPGNVPSPTSQGSDVGVASDFVPSQPDIALFKSSLNDTEPEEILTVEVYDRRPVITTDVEASEPGSQGELHDSDATTALSLTDVRALPSAGHVMNQSQPLPQKYSSVGHDGCEDIVFSSHNKKTRRKAKHAEKEKDIANVSLIEQYLTLSREDIVSSSDGSVQSTQDLDRVSPSLTLNDPARPTDDSHDESEALSLSEHLSETYICDVKTEQESVRPGHRSISEVETTVPVVRDTAAGEKCLLPETKPIRVSMSDTELHTKRACSTGVHRSCETEVTREHTPPQNRTFSGAFVKDLVAGISNSVNCDATESDIVEQSADMPEMSGKKDGAEVPVNDNKQLEDPAADVTALFCKRQLDDTTVPSESGTHPRQLIVDPHTKNLSHFTTSLPTESLQHSTATKQSLIKPITFPRESSDRSYVGDSRKNRSTRSPPESPGDFYSKYHLFNAFVSDRKSDVSLDQAIEHSVEDDDSHRDTVQADTWSEFPMSDKFDGLLSMCMSERHVWCVDKHETVAYSRTNKPQPNWREASVPAHQVVVSSSGAIVWRLHKHSVYVALYVTPVVPLGTKWIEVAREVKHIAVDDDVAWYVKDNGELMIQKGLCRERPSFRSLAVPCSHRIHQVSCYSGIVWVLTEECHLLARTGIERGREEGAGWKQVGSDEGSCPEAISFDFGHDNSVWMLDINGHLWFTTGVTQLTPGGSGTWWQVSLSQYVMHDATMLDTTHSTLKALTTKLLGGYMGGEMTGVLTARHSGVWLWFPSNGKKILTCRGTLTGHRWQLVTPGGLLSSVKWIKLSLGSVSGDKEGYVWLQLPNGDIFSFLPSSKKLIEVAPPVSGQSFSCISGTRDALWGLLAGGRVYIRTDIGGRCLHGRSWAQQTMIQLGDARLASISCGTQNVVVVDNTGQVYLRIGVLAPDKHHLCPAWVPLDGTTSMAGTKFTSVYTSPGDWLFQIWAIDSRNAVYVRKGVTDDLPIGTHWLYVSGIQASSLCISNQFVYALTPEGNIYVRYGVSHTDPAGDYWKEVPGHFVAFAVTASDDMWALSESGQLHRRSVHHIHCDQRQYTRARATGSNDDGWELI